MYNVGSRLKQIGSLFRDSASAWSDDNAPRLGASLAFYTLLSMAPLLVVIVGVAALAFGREAAEGQLAWQIQGLVGRPGARVIQDVIRAAYRPGTGIAAAVLSLVTLLLGASSVVGELRDALNIVWHVPSAPGATGLRGLARLVKQRLYTFVMVLGVGFLLMISLVLSAWIAAMGKFFGTWLPVPEWALHGVNFLVSFIVITFLFAAIYKVLPDLPIEWSDVAVGAAVTALIFSAGKQLIALYLGKASFASTYGAAGSLVVVLVWVYYSAQLFFFGAEFTKLYTQKYGSHFARRLEPAPPQPSNVVLDASGHACAGSPQNAEESKIQLSS